MLARCRTSHIRDRAMDLLLEALDTNALATDAHEAQALQHLWSELVHVFRSVIDDRRRRRAMAGGLAFAPRAAQLPSPFAAGLHNGAASAIGGSPHDRGVAELLESALDTKVLVDGHLERVLGCLQLTMQRIEYARDVKPFDLLPVMDESFQLLLEDLQLVRSDDPYVLQLISSIADSVHFAMTATHNEDKEEVMAFPIGISLLSQIVRMVIPDDLLTMYESFHGIMADLSEKGQWHLGRKFIRILAAAAMLKQEACILFIRFVRDLEGLNWQWQFLGILCLGAIACSSEASPIRRLALEDGLFVYADHGSELRAAAPKQERQQRQIQTPDLVGKSTLATPDPTSLAPAPPSTAAAAGSHVLGSHAADGDARNRPAMQTALQHAWKLRAAVAVALTEIYQQYRSQPHGLLAREVMSKQRSQETHLVVQRLLNAPAAIAPQEKTLRRISFLFKYTCVSLAELYADTQSDYMYLRKYVRTAERNESRRRAQRMKHGSTVRLDDVWEHASLGRRGPQMTFDGLGMLGGGGGGGGGGGASVARSVDGDHVSRDACSNASPVAGQSAMAMLMRSMNSPLPSQRLQEAAKQSTRSRLTKDKVERMITGGGLAQLSIDPYHTNYKRVRIQPSVISDSFEEFLQEFHSRPPIPSLAQLPPLAPSTLPSYMPPPAPPLDADKVVSQPSNGTANRRKLFNVDRLSLAEQTYLAAAEAAVHGRASRTERGDHQEKHEHSTTADDSKQQQPVDQTKVVKHVIPTVANTDK
nr:hypothetical protein HK105_006494 [Polyrhizophydium stewartii]